MSWRTGLRGVGRDVAYIGLGKAGDDGTSCCAVAHATEIFLEPNGGIAFIVTRDQGIAHVSGNQLSTPIASLSLSININICISFLVFPISLHF